MIYLIGGPPKCGKTTLAKKLSHKLGAPWIAADTLQAIAREYTNKKELPKKFLWSTLRKQTKQNNDLAYSTYTSKQIVKAYTTQAKATHAAIEMVSICEIKDGNDYIIEGYQVTPQLVERLIKKYGKENFRSVFLIRKDVDQLVIDFQKSTASNDWVLKHTKNKATYYKIAAMISEYGKFFERESKEHGLKVFNMDEDFRKQLEKIEKYLTG